MATLDCSSWQGLVKATSPIRSRSDHAAFVLFGLLAKDLNRRWLAKGTRTMGWALTAYACIPYLVVGSKSVAVAKLVIWQNLATLSWLAGLAALVVAAPDTGFGPAALARLRGVPPAALQRVEWAAACSVPFKILAPAGLVISTLATAQASDWTQARRAILTVLAVACYALVTSGVLGLSALWSRRLAPARGRTLFALLMLVPLLLERGISMHSVPTLLGAYLDTSLLLGNDG